MPHDPRTARCPSLPAVLGERHCEEKMRRPKSQCLLPSGYVRRHRQLYR
jgi:hypothetical protein